MNRQQVTLLVAGFCLLPVAARADVIMPLAVVTVPLLPAIVLIEALPFRFLLNRRYRVGLGFWRAVGVILLANIATSALGAVLPAPLLPSAALRLLRARRPAGGYP